MGFLFWLLSIWTLPRPCGINDKMQVLYKEMTRDGVKFKVAKSEFDRYTNVKARKNCLEIV